MINQLSIPFKKTRADISDIPRVITWKFAVARVEQFDKYIYYVQMYIELNQYLQRKCKH